MMFFPNPATLAGGVVQERTYPEFEAHISGLATAERVWADDAVWGAGDFLTTASTLAGGMVGSSWLAPFRGIATATTTCRVVQHGLATFADVSEQIANGRKLLVRVSISSTQTGYSSRNRNNYISLSSGSNLQPRQCDEILAWIDGRAMRMQPYLGLGPTPYDW